LITMARRRRRAIEDRDDYLERQYSRKRLGDSAASSHQEEANVGVNEEPKKKKPKGDLEDAVKSGETQLEKKDDDGADKIEKLRLKKLRRKEDKKAKQEQQQKEKELEKIQKRKLEEKKKKQAAVKAKKEKSTSENPYTRTKLGVQYQDILVGKGPAVQDRKKVRVSYVLRVGNKRGKILDSSDDFAFRLGRGEVIKGWDIGVQGMRQGGQRYLIVPPEAGYGRDNIGGGSGAILFFEVTVVAC
jgi:FKBP-type peptidyl-prolyl cis-trans isomerase